MSTTAPNSDWHANKRDYDEYRTPDVESKAELYGRLIALTDEYTHVVVVSKFRTHGGHHNREVKPEALEYDPERDSLDIYGRPATGRYPRPETFEGLKLWE